MKVAGLGPGEPAFIIVRSTFPAPAVSVLAGALEGKTLRDDFGIKQVQFPKTINVASLLKKLEPGTEAEMLALQYVTEVAARMAVHFSLTREAYDCRWVVAMSANLLDSAHQRVVPVSLGNENPLSALKDIARQMSGRLLSSGNRDFRAPVIPSVQLTLQESILARKLKGRRRILAADPDEGSTSPFAVPADDGFGEAGEGAGAILRPQAQRDLPEARRSDSFPDTR
jgi:hypothetical protein